MSYTSRNHLFLYHAHALALGGWVRDRNHQFTALPALAPSVLSITGGYASNSESRVNFYTPGQYLWGPGASSNFQLYVGHAYTEVRGTVEDDEHPYGAYQTTVRSVLDDVRINDVFSVEHAETILRSTHPYPGGPGERGGPDEEPDILIGESNMSGVRVSNAKVGLTKHATIDNVPKYSAEIGAAPSLTSWNDPSAFPAPAPDLPDDYGRDTATINQNARHHFRYSIFEDIDVPRTTGVRKVKTSVEVVDFGRIFFGEVIASKRTKHVTMFRIDLGCDNCGGIGGSGGTTNGGPMP